MHPDQTLRPVVGRYELPAPPVVRQTTTGRDLAGAVTRAWSAWSAAVTARYAAEVVALRAEREALRGELGMLDEESRERTRAAMREDAAPGAGDVRDATHVRG